jgi:hypothetical protein
MNKPHVLLIKQRRRHGDGVETRVQVDNEA